MNISVGHAKPTVRVIVKKLKQKQQSINEDLDSIFGPRKYNKCLNMKNAKFNATLEQKKIQLEREYMTLSEYLEAIYELIVFSD